MDEPKTTRGRRTRAAIVETAAALMYQRGVRATSLDDILDAAGCGKSQLYHYFTGRAELLAAIVDYQLQRILGDQGSYELDTWKGLRAWLDSLVARQQQGFRGCPLGSLVSEMLAEDDRLRETVAAAYARWEDELQLPLTRMRKAGKLAPSAQPDALARHLLAAIQGGYLLSTIRHDPRPMREALNAAYAHLRAHR
jgi:TetR/AcrR family transcriptional regulator, transcriptional repressor for nem operon